MEKIHTVYIMAKGRNSTFYTGYSSELLVRSAKHKSGYYPNAFTKKYGIDKLVYYEVHAEEAEARLIETLNPHWNDLFDTLQG